MNIGRIITERKRLTMIKSRLENDLRIVKAQIQEIDRLVLEDDYFLKRVK